MESTIYIVGGAVRDTLLGRSVKDFDYVVVGATPEDMLSAEFTQVGADFPVFLDKDGNEYALARTERKTGVGYNGFETQYDPSVTLEDDLFRRDLCCNALAVHVDDWDEFVSTKNPKFVVDPFGGIQDLNGSVLRHVSAAFSEDPVRVLRVARFAARYNFSIDQDTLDLMQRLVDSGELDSLTPERVYAEMEKAVMEDTPIVFFQTLQIIGANDVLFPEWFTDDRLPLMVSESLERSVLLSGDFLDRMIILTAGLKAETVKQMLVRLKAPNEVMKMMQMSCTLIRSVLDRAIDFDTAEDIVKVLDEVNAWKHVEQFQKVMAVFSIFDNDWLRNVAFVLLKGLKIGNVANFDMLTTEQKDTLQGANISKAIADIRFDLINNIC